MDTLAGHFLFCPVLINCFEHWVNLFEILAINIYFATTVRCLCSTTVTIVNTIQSVCTGPSTSPCNCSSLPCVVSVFINIHGVVL